MKNFKEQEEERREKVFRRHTPRSPTPPWGKGKKKDL